MNTETSRTRRSRTGRRARRSVLRAEETEAIRTAGVFAALGDETRLGLVLTLSRGDACSISRLSEGAPVTRQAVTKHLRVLRAAGLVRDVRRGRERLFELAPERVAEARAALEGISHRWDEALGRLKAFVER